MLLSNIGARAEYHVVDIRVFAPAVQGEPYPVELSIAGWRDFPPSLLRVDHPALQAELLDPRAYGRLLGQALFADDTLGTPYRETVAAIQGRGEGLRVRLRIDPPELQSIHWERLFHPLAGAWSPLGTTASTPFSRYVLTQAWERPTPVTRRPLRVLAVIASPTHLERYGLDALDPAERQAVHAMLDGLADVSVTYLESGTAAPPTVSGLRKALAEGYHLIHVLCHGAATPAGSVLYLEQDDGSVEPVVSDRLVSSFKALAQPPLCAFLAACESAARGRSDAFVPLGPALVQGGGLHAVIAMSERVGVQTARQFAEQFYARLLNHGLVDLAVNEARALVEDEWDWGVPVLFSRLPDNQLLDFPVGNAYREYLAHTDRAYMAVDEALAIARRQDHGQQLVSNLERLIKELSKSHGVLVDRASAFRRVDNDPATFADNFKHFYFDFKDYYDRESWVDEETSCREIAGLAGQILPRLGSLLQQETFDQLQEELQLLSNVDRQLILSFGEYLEAMDGAVEEIWARVQAGEIEAALQLKRDFEAQISPSFRQSKEMLKRMSGSLTLVQRA